jgi:hypothetical protein
MKKLLLLSALLIFACSSDGGDNNIDNNQDCISLLTNKTWFPVEETSEIFTYIRFDSNGDFYEEGQLDGTWDLESNCSTINFDIIGSSIDFSYEIVSINQNLMVVNTVLGQVSYENFYVEGGSFVDDYNGLVWEVEEVNGEEAEEAIYISFGLNSSNEFQLYNIQDCDDGDLDYEDVYNGYASAEIIIDDGDAMIFRYNEDIESLDNYYEYIFKVKNEFLEIISVDYGDGGMEEAVKSELSITNLDNPCE